ncbi:Serine/threonine-protein kinase tousled-like 2, partial [Frankliniella fusca]
GDRAWFNGSYVWLVVDGGDGGGAHRPAPPHPTTWALRLDSEVFLAAPSAPDADSRAWRVDEVFRVNAEDAAVRWPFASWSPGAGLVAAVSPGGGGDLDPFAEHRFQLRRAFAGQRPLRVEASVYVRPRACKIRHA